MIKEVMDIPDGAILQRDKKSFAIVPRIPLGLATPENLENIARVARKYKIPIIKITAGHRIALVGIDKDKVDQIYAELDMDIGRATELCLHYVQTCPGNQLCRYGVQDSLGLAAEIESFFLGSELPAKVKIGVSGCAFNCGESMIRDVGVYGKRKGWTVSFGGNGARFPRVGDVLAENLSKEEVIDLIKRCLDYYNKHALRPERTARFIRRIGIDVFKKAVLSD